MIEKAFVGISVIAVAYLLIVVGVLIYHTPECNRLGYKDAVITNLNLYNVGCQNLISEDDTVSLKELRKMKNERG